ncbi:beta-galactosidase 7-like [Cucumis melo var. makuwa]|uniref:beta-galactosidase n=1 Tax=Cucumis melo var. makuwa TaxID=1194695 RepID=A0A5A7U9L8_CUCMM|nr:beta-galactosidase 7-like [Cucumis melo var. makuwa]
MVRFFQSGGVFNNYYMYHGGTNFGRTSGGPFITTSYDYNAPLDEYGNLNPPKWGHLKQLHASIKLGETILTNGTRSDQNFGSSVTLTKFFNPTTGERFCFLSNTDGKNDATIDLQVDRKYFVPAWSVSILDGCNKEVYNTAKVNSQTSMFVKEQNEKENTQLSWAWAPKPMKDTLQGNGKFAANQLLEQKRVMVDFSDYFWYMTSVETNETSSLQNVTLQVNTKGHVLHAFVNKRYIGSQWGSNGQSFVFEKPVLLKSGTNTITLLSATVGLKNYDAFYDMVPTEIDGGRFWPSFIAGNDSCSAICDYRGAYNPRKCVENCGNPSQRWHHVPRSFLSSNTNTLILFEEIGGNPQHVSVQTITIGTICANANEGSILELSCQGGHVIFEIQFASYGNLEGKCGSFKQGSWDVTNSALFVVKACIGMESCSIDVSAKSFGLGDATNLSARLTVQALCAHN